MRFLLSTTTESVRYLEERDANDVLVTGLDFRKNSFAKGPIQFDLSARRLRAFTDDVFHFLDVYAGATDDAQGMRQYARSIQMAHHHEMSGW